MNIISIFIKIYLLALKIKNIVFRSNPKITTVYDVIENIETACFNISDKAMVKTIRFELSKSPVSKDKIIEYLTTKVEYFNSRLAFENTTNAADIAKRMDALMPRRNGWRSQRS